MTNKLSCYLFGAVLLLCAVFAHPQTPLDSPTPVSPAPSLHIKFTDANGDPLGGGFLYTYAAGTTSFLNTYTDSTGTQQNPSIIPLDGSGAPTNGGGVSTQIWLQNSAYKICAYNSLLVLQWCADNVTGYLNLLNLGNTWTLQQTFTQPIVDTQTDNQFVLGAAGQQTTLDFPPPLADIVLHFPNTADTIVGQNTTDTLANKSLVNPKINGVPVSNSPGTYFNLTNTPPGTQLNYLVSAATSSASVFATITPAGNTGGVLGICVNICGTTGIAAIQQSGSVACVFDGATTNGDYITISATAAGECHDAGVFYPTDGQVIGRVLTTNAGGGTYTVVLFGPEIRALPDTGGSVGFTAGSGAGTGPVIACSGFSSNCQDRGGTFNVTTGTSPAANATIVTVNFSVSHTKVFCGFSPGSATAVAAPVFEGTSGSTVFSLGSTGTALTGSTTYTFTYVCNFQN